MTDNLEALLARAVDLEVKTAAALEEAAGRELTDDAREDLEAQAREKYDGEVDAELVAELEERLEAVDEALDEVLADTSLPGVDPQADYEAGSDDDDVAGMDFDEPDEPVAHKALGCSQCGGHDVDELVTGVVQCGHCGWQIKAAPPLEGPRDFDED